MLINLVPLPVAARRLLVVRVLLVLSSTTASTSNSARVTKRNSEFLDDQALYYYYYSVPVTRQLLLVVVLMRAKSATLELWLAGKEFRPGPRPGTSLSTVSPIASSISNTITISRSTEYES